MGRSQRNMQEDFMLNIDGKQYIVLTIHGKDGGIPVIYFSCFTTLKDAHIHCKIINTLKPGNNEWIYARIIDYSKKYQLSKPPEKYDFEILRLLSNEDIQKVEGMIYKKYEDFFILVKALKGASGETQERFFTDYKVNPINSTTYTSKEYETLDEFKSFLASIDDSVELVKEAKNAILKIINELFNKGELLFPLVETDD
jgi:flagellar motor switch protein FliG